jgi:hypothetical protein
MKPSAPANDVREWTTDDYWMVCDCGSSTFHLLWREGFCFVLCGKCEQDHTMSTIWGKRDAK